MMIKIVLSCYLPSIQSGISLLNPLSSLKDCLQSPLFLHCLLQGSKDQTHREMKNQMSPFQRKIFLPQREIPLMQRKTLWTQKDMRSLRQREH
eukprot:5685678-Ditylum_brightwellii.AAC.1